MAVTGKTAIAVTPAKGRRVRVATFPEHSTQSGKKGQPARISAGYLSAITGNITNLIGFYRNAPQTGASDGAKTASVYLAEADTPYVATYLGTLSESVRGLRVNISVDSAGATWLKRDTDSSSAAYANVIGWDTTRWAAGDVNPEVTFTILNTGIQSGN